MRDARYDPGMVALRFGLALCAASVGLGALGMRDAAACSCVGPRSSMLTPDRLDDAPLNTKVRIELAPRARAAGSAKPKVVLRAHGQAGEVAVTPRSMPSGSVEVVELAPNAPLAPSTQYEVAVIEESLHPSTLVVGTFRTGTTADTTPPKVERFGRAVAYKNLTAGGGDCSIRGPWIEVSDVAASDPSRPNAQTMWAVWRAKDGKLDTKAAPATIVGTFQGTLTIGKRSLCDPHEFSLPKEGSITLAVAAVDEAGNASPPRTVVIDIGAAVVSRGRR